MALAADGSTVSHHGWYSALFALASEGSDLASVAFGSDAWLLTLVNDRLDVAANGTGKA